MIDSLWARVQELERRISLYVNTIRDLRVQVATLQQQLNAARSN